MLNWVWIEEAIVLAIHEEQLAEHGGGLGVRERGLLASALARPRNLVAYTSSSAADAAAIAAAYAYGIIRNHPFIDGNKRTGFVLLELFLNLNGYRLNAGDTDCVTTMLKLASGTISEAELVSWVRNHFEPAGNK